MTQSDNQRDNMRPKRISPISFPPFTPILAQPAKGDSEAVRDAFRECRFALSPDINWLQQTLVLQRDLVEASYPTKYRNPRYAASLLLWSRIYSTGIETLRLTTLARYAACPSLIRSCIEWLGSESAVEEKQGEDFVSWLNAAFIPNQEKAATEFGMGQFFSSEMIAADQELAIAYQGATELARPHFGVSALLLAPESNRDRIQIHWGDESFHLGWSEMLFEWQILIQQRQVNLALNSKLFAQDSSVRDTWQKLNKEAELILNKSSRCKLESVRIDGQDRLIILNFRRRASGAPQRILL